MITLKYKCNSLQVPCPFGLHGKDTLECTGVDIVAVNTGKGDADLKRLCTLQIAVRCLPKEEWKKQPRGCICFRGKPGNPYYDKEREAYDKRVDVLSQNKAWFDGTTCIEYVNTTLTPLLLSEKVEGESFLVIMDNLGGQVTPEFKQRLRNIGARYSAP